MDTDPTGIYCQAGRRPDVLHEPMPSGLQGAPRWMSSGPAEDGAARDRAGDDAAHDDSPRKSRSVRGRDADATGNRLKRPQFRTWARGREAHRHESR
ncbi:hypothetical protein BN971_04850 [Mycobacterium bohemicum DSM 44277]|uniref:Uncharacterized protein n=1 Tax=Mycobacterium bohemicum DSM 44277 TaxID=1236609 RepID=A0A0U0WF08_MYCBE|nr:hypothetical protein [Mycobacterium bohemicum]CPR13538.1 hypothetical protein BN971_04850 [Mycobacterium bohemicum DSM 44277]